MRKTKFRKTSRITLNFTPEEIKLFRKEAKAQKLSLTQYIVKVIELAVKYDM